MANVVETLQTLNLKLPPAPAAVGSYLPALEIDNRLYLSGQLPKDCEGRLVEGTLGRDLSLEQGVRAAELAALNVLSLIQASVGFERVERIIKVVGYVQCVESFNEIPQVINGASDLFAKVLGDNGKHVRSAVGMISLPLNAAVELEVTLALKTAE